MHALQKLSLCCATLHPVLKEPAGHARTLHGPTNPLKTNVKSSPGFKDMVAANSPCKLITSPASGRAGTKETRA